MIRLAALGVVLLALRAALPSRHAVAAPDSAPLVLVAHLDGVVNPMAAQYVHRVVTAATEQNAALLVLTIDTPGGLDTSMRPIVQDLLNSVAPRVASVA